MSGIAKSSLRRRGAIASLVLLVLFLAAWQWGPGLLRIPPFIVPPLSTVLNEAVRMWHVNGLLFHTGITSAEVIIGFILGSLLGAFFGYVLGMSPTAEVALSPYILALQIAPKVAFAPLFILWMGFTIYPKILVAVLIVFFPVMVNVLGADHSGYVKRLEAAVNAVSHGEASIDVRICQLVRLMKNGEPFKMSKPSAELSGAASRIAVTDPSRSLRSDASPARSRVKS